MEQLDNFDEQHLLTFSRQVLKMIQADDPEWASHIPSEVARVIRERGFLGCRRMKTAEAVFFVSDSPATMMTMPTVGN